jgi:AraC-like DNA-binding protein
MTVMIRSGVLRNYSEVATDVGLNAPSLLRSVNLNHHLIEDPEGQIPINIVLQLLEKSAQESNCWNFGLRMAASRNISDLGAISLLLTHQRTLKDVLAATVRYRHLLNQSLALQIETSGRTVVIREELVSVGPSRQGIELAIGVLVRTCSSMLGTGWRPNSVHFTHSAPDDLQVHKRVFRCKVEFNSSFNGMVCDTASLEAPNPVADPVMAKYAEQFVSGFSSGQEISLIDEVRRAIYLLLPTGNGTIQQVAQGLGLTVRTLQRRLDFANAKFSNLINEIRRELVVRYIGNPHYPIQKIGQLLGYAEPNSFTRWFTNEFGMSPRDWRNRNTR